MAAIDVSVVAYEPDFALLGHLFASLAEGAPDGIERHLFVLDNSATAGTDARIAAMAILQPDGPFASVSVQRSPANVGFGRGHNANVARGTAPFVLVINQDCIVEPGALAALVASAEASPADVAAWEMRQVPYEHPKAYDPVTLDTPWASGAAVLLRRAAFEAIGGFEPRIFMYGEDVDLSWRLRAAGHRILYQPRCAVVHRTYREAGEVKPLQVLGGVLTNLCLRARFGGVVRTFEGLAMLGAEVLARPGFRGRRLGLVRAFFGFLARWPHFAATRVRPTATFRPVFAGWGYEVRRDGAFATFTSRREAPRRAMPLVSILIRTMDRPGWLRQALASCANQTYPEIEVIVVEDGPDRSRAVVDAFRDRLRIDYQASGSRVGRARAGNLALARARGEWLNFLDDDDVLFADHVEVLVDAVRDGRHAGAYALAWETQARPGAQAGEPACEEAMHLTRYHQPFDRLALWHHNYLPIQAVLFHRRLYERHGGFEEDMDQLEDWNLWTRYTLDDDFVLVEKTTSKYRVPADASIAAGRQAKLDLAYADALRRQLAMSVRLSPREISTMAERYARSQAVMMVTRSDVRRFLGNGRARARLASYRTVASRGLRRMGWLK